MDCVHVTVVIVLFTFRALNKNNRKIPTEHRIIQHCVVVVVFFSPAIRTAYDYDDDDDYNWERKACVVWPRWM